MISSSGASANLNTLPAHKKSGQPSFDEISLGTLHSKNSTAGLPSAGGANGTSKPNYGATKHSALKGKRNGGVAEAGNKR